MTNTKRIGRYGIAHHTIRYYQRQAKDLYRYNGIYNGRGALESCKLDEFSGRAIGIAAICFAAVASPEHVKAVLDGARGNRWAL